ncbi:glycosyltransferase family 39 protein [Candidatus Omnitrophota bacterium]
MLILFIAIGFFIFSNLSDHALSNDEASTSVMGRNTLNFGYPRGFDGVNWNYPTFPELILPGSYLWISDVWVQFYLIAMSFKLFGISTWSARIGFAMAGFLTIILVYGFCFRYLKSKKIGLLSILLLGTSVPFLLHVREARYYGLVIFLCFAVFYLYYRIVEERKGYILLGCILSILSWTNHAAFVPMFASIWLMAFFIDRDKIRWKYFITMSIVSVLFLSAWLSIWWPTAMLDSVEYPLNQSLLHFKKNFEFQIRTINGYFAPVAFWLILLIALRIFKKRDVLKPSAEESTLFKKIGIVLACNIAFFTVFGMRSMRYYVQYIAFLCILEGYIFYRLFKWKKYMALIFLALLIFTNFLGRPNPLFLTKGLPEPFDFSKDSKFRTYFLDYLYELTHEYTGPLEALCDYLDLHAKQSEDIKIIKGDLTVLFYHPELVVINDARYFRKSYPKWLVIRQYWNSRLESVWRNKLKAEIEDGYLDVLDRYEKIPLPAVDSIRENEADNLNTHFFKTPIVTPENQMFVYRRKN